MYSGSGGGSLPSEMSSARVGDEVAAIYAGEPVG